MFGWVLPLVPRDFFADFGGGHLAKTQTPAALSLCRQDGMQVMAMKLNVQHANEDGLRRTYLVVLAVIWVFVASVAVQGRPTYFWNLRCLRC